jgi:hypothetical protein
MLSRVRVHGTEHGIADSQSAALFEASRAITTCLETQRSSWSAILNRAQRRLGYCRRGKSACPPVSSRYDIRAEYISHRDCSAPVGEVRTEGLI